MPFLVRDLEQLLGAQLVACGDFSQLDVADALASMGTSVEAEAILRATRGHGDATVSALDRSQDDEAHQARGRDALLRFAADGVDLHDLRAVEALDDARRKGWPAPPAPVILSSEPGDVAWQLARAGVLRWRMGESTGYWLREAIDDEWAWQQRRRLARAAVSDRCVAIAVEGALSPDAAARAGRIIGACLGVLGWRARVEDDVLGRELVRTLCRVRDPSWSDAAEPEARIAVVADGDAGVTSLPLVASGPASTMVSALSHHLLAREDLRSVEALVVALGVLAADGIELSRRRDAIVAQNRLTGRELIVAPGEADLLRAAGALTVDGAPPGEATRRR